MVSALGSGRPGDLVAVGEVEEAVAGGRVGVAVPVLVALRVAGRDAALGGNRYRRLGCAARRELDLEADHLIAFERTS